MTPLLRSGSGVCPKKYRYNVRIETNVWWPGLKRSRWRG